jgi:carbamoyl-phosphate synthase large subunit
MQQINVLVTSVGGIVAQGIIKSLKYHNNYTENKKYVYNIIGTDIIFDSAGLYRTDKFSIISKPETENFIQSIIDLCIDNSIDLIFVGSDVELFVFSKNKEVIESKTSAKIISNPINVIDICRDKFKTFQFLKINKLNFIPSCLVEESDEFIKEYGFPVIVKPCEGFGSKFLNIVNNKDEMSYSTSVIENYGWKPLIQKYLKNDNREFTVGITIDKKGENIMSSIAIKKILKHGQTYKAIIDKFPEIKEISEKTAKKIKAIGAINIQLRVDEEDNIPKIIEINPRLSSTCPMRTVAGVNEPDILSKDMLFNEKIKITDYKSLLCLRYWNETYLDLNNFNEIQHTNHKTKKMKSFIIDYF